MNNNTIFALSSASGQAGVAVIRVSGDKVLKIYELLTGKTLKEKLDERGYYSPEEAIEYMLQILDATKHIHDRGILHNDLKPDNMFLFYDGNIKLLDFGIATHIGEKPEDKANATIYYAAPEVLRSKEYSIRSDLYSLGIIFHIRSTTR